MNRFQMILLGTALAIVALAALLNGAGSPTASIVCSLSAIWIAFQALGETADNDVPEALLADEPQPRQAEED